MKNKKIDWCEDLRPVIEIGEEIDGRCLGATYYNDLSGQISIENNNKQIFFKDDGTLKHHIKYLEEDIKKLKKDHINNINFFKKAISLLKKEHLKFKKVKK